MKYLPFNKKSFFLTLLGLALCGFLHGSAESTATFAVDCLWEFSDQIAEAEMEATDNFYYCRQEPYAIAWRCHHENDTRFNRAVDNAIVDYENCVRRNGN